MGRPLGTLIVVVLKARNLPNKQRIGKQDPYATCTYLSHRKRTKTDKRGGQHPVWDDELRFEIYEHIKDVMPSTSVATTSTGGVAPVKSSDPSLGMGGNPGVKELRVAVYADDPRDPELIGEGKVELTETLKKGEFDDWVTITNKGKYQGEIYLEMTFYSAKPPPDKLQNPGTPVRAGVFEAGSPASGLKPTQPGRNKLSTPNGRQSTSPAPPSPSKVDPWNIPPSLRAGVSTTKSSAPPSGNLPLPGERGQANPRNRSTESLGSHHPALPVPHTYRSPSRNHSFDEAAALMNSMQISDTSAANGPHNHQLGLAPSAAPNPPYHSNDHLGRPHRHSFSSYSRPSSPYPGNSPGQANLDLPPNAGSIPRIPTPNDQPNADGYPTHHQLAFSQNAAQNSGRRPLPIPGGETANRPTSAWGDHGIRRTSNAHTAAVSPQHSRPLNVHSHYPLRSHTASFSGPSYLPSIEQIAFPSHSAHEEATEAFASPHQPLGLPHSSHQPTDQPPRQFHTPAPPLNMHPTPGYQPAAPLRYSLPPPPSGQAPVPIHEVYRAVTPRPLPPPTSHQSFRPQSPHRPQLLPYSNPNHHNQLQLHHPPPHSSSSNDMGYGHEIYPPNSTQPTHGYPNFPESPLHQQQYGPPVPGAPPPPPHHLQHQLQHPGYQSQPGRPVPLPHPIQNYHGQQALPPSAATSVSHSRQPSPFHDPHNSYRAITPAPKFSSPLPPPPPQQHPAFIHSPPRNLVPMPGGYPPMHY